MAKVNKPAIKKAATPRKTSTTAKAQKSKPYVEEGLPMTPKQAKQWGKLNMSPKTSTTLFTIPKGAAKLPQKEIDAIQRRRVADRQRTLARAKAIIKRNP
jgi:hypothetical protein